MSQILEYKYNGKYYSYSTPVYIDVPFKEIKPTKPADHRDHARDSRGWLNLKPEDFQVYRLVIHNDDRVFLAEGSTIIHSDFQHCLKQLGLATELYPNDYRSQGIVYFLPDKIVIFLNDKTKYLPPHWDQLLDGVIYTLDWRD